MDRSCETENVYFEQLFQILFNRIIITKKHTKYTRTYPKPLTEFSIVMLVFRCIHNLSKMGRILIKMPLETNP